MGGTRVGLLLDLMCGFAKPSSDELEMRYKIEMFWRIERRERERERGEREREEERERERERKRERQDTKEREEILKQVGEMKRCTHTHDR